MTLADPRWKTTAYVRKNKCWMTGPLSEQTTERSYGRGREEVRGQIWDQLASRGCSLGRRRLLMNAATPSYWTLLKWSFRHHNNASFEVWLSARTVWKTEISIRSQNSGEHQAGSGSGNTEGDTEHTRMTLSVGGRGEACFALSLEAAWWVLFRNLHSSKNQFPWLWCRKEC